MRALCETFRDSEEPVVLVFFARPQAVARGEQLTYAALGIDLDAPGETGAAAHLSDGLSDLGKQCGKGAAGKGIPRRRADGQPGAS